jgi:hypothetical protein
LKVWKEFLVNFNGKCFFLEDRFISADLLQLYTDASGSMGYGAVFQQSWFYGEWDENWEYINIKVSIPRKVKQVEGPIVFSGAMGIPILSHIVKNSSKYLLHISNEQIKKIIQNMKHHTIWHKYLSHIVKACTKSFKNLTGR